MVSFHNFSVTPLYHVLQRLMRLCRPLCLAVPLWAASTGLASAESWKVNLQDADIKAFINEVATITDQNFVLDPRINVVAYGESRPVADNSTEYGRQQNRRVELTINAPNNVR